MARRKKPMFRQKRGWASWLIASVVAASVLAAALYLTEYVV